MDGYFSEDCNYMILYEETDLQPVSSKRSNTQVNTGESLLAAQREDLLKVMDFLSTKEYHARALLIHYQWDVEKLLDVFVEKGKDSLFSGAGVTVFDSPYGSNSSFSHSSEMSCDVCIEDVPGDHMTRRECGHFYCNNCESTHTDTSIEDKLRVTIYEKVRKLEKRELEFSGLGHQWA